ncbi:ComEC/Rec2 family competence protein [Pseudonocardia alaniniphila]|uniref:ComEC/Rec2 family competence protein n=2 Tax=Pseudonocardia alaniniphila TaxID=75291 RepID=A0ABS9TG79_9PSEU|nr:ComEC/Rec2 family competence protein [Pseudonocardia alaniniphila]MCH6167393.1 ComEC/Rec2 family competence protein [Pseudonocardia alaniniphila]
MRARDPGEPRRPPDLRLVPAALAVWAVMLIGIGFGPVAALGTGAAAVVILAVFAMPALRPRRGAPAVLAAAGCAAAAAVVATAHTLLLVQHPLPEPAERGAAATLRVVLRDDPRPIRTEAYGSTPGIAGQVLIPSVLAGVQVDAGHWSAGGRVLLIAPAEGWAGLLPGQSATAEGLLAPAGRRDLTIAVLRVRGPPHEVTPAPWWQHAAGGLRSGLREAAAAVLSPAPAGLLPGLAVGDTAGLTSEVEADFRAAGLTHLLAVSGANLAIVGGAVLALLRLLRADPRLAAALSAAAIAGFVVLARPSPSVVRAAAMGAVVLLALALGRGRSALPALAVAVLVLLLIDPALAVDPGFALSVLATAALVLLAPGWTDAMRRKGVPTWAAEALAVPAAAFLVTAPLVAGLSGAVSPIAVVANLLAVPAVAPATVLGVLAAVLSPLGSAPAQACAWLAGPAVGWLVEVADRTAAVPGAVLPWPDGLTGALLLGGLVLVLLVLGRSRRWRAMLLAVLVGLGLVLVPTRLVPPGWPPAGWAVVACDVGQGDAVVLATGRPGWVVLVDAGPGDGPVDACLDRLGVEGIAMVVLSHLHADHVGGLAGALRGRPVGAVAVGPVHEPHWALRTVARQAAEAGAPLVALTAGQRLRWPGLTVDVLAPRHPAFGVDPDDGTAVNDGSLVLRATMPAATALLTGDVELAAQADLLASGADLRADVLKLPHHGSRYTSDTFLTAVAPRTVLVSVGAGNRYRHPDPGLLGGLERRGAAVRRTDIHGDIAVVADVAAGAGDAERAPLQVVSRGSPLPAPRRGPSWRPPLRPVPRPHRCAIGVPAGAGRRGRRPVGWTCRRRRRDAVPGQRDPPGGCVHRVRATARRVGSETALTTCAGRSCRGVRAAPRRGRPRRPGWTTQARGRSTR